MATNSRKNPAGQSGKDNKLSGRLAKPVTKPRQPPAPEDRTAVGQGPAKSAAQNAARRASGSRSGIDKTQVYIMAVAIVVIIAVIIFSFVLNNKNTAAQNEGYGSARATVATVADGVITVSAADATPAPLALDVFEDPLCPFCGALERQFGQQMAQAMDEGKLTIRYHLLTFLDGKAASPDYSTRAAGALMCVAQNLGSEPGLYSRFHDQLFAKDVQPVEDGDKDLTNEQLVEQLTTALGSTQAPATAAATQCILTGANAALVATENTAASAILTASIGQVSSPVVLKDGVGVNTDDVNWLTNLLAAAATP